MDILNKDACSVELDGKKYQLTQMTLGDFADLSSAIRDSKRESLKTMLEDRELRRDAIKMIVAPVTLEDIEEYSSTAEGVMALMYIALKRAGFEGTQRELGNLMTLEAAGEIVAQLSPSESDGDGEKKQVPAAPVMQTLNY